jgi:hypothetical protein
MGNRNFRSRQNRISKTAGNMALIRALEFLRSPNQRLFSDPYARQFVPVCQRVLLGPAHLPAIRTLLERFFDWRAPGARLGFGHFESDFQAAARRVARAIGEERSRKSTSLQGCRCISSRSWLMMSRQEGRLALRRHLGRGR